MWNIGRFVGLGVKVPKGSMAASNMPIYTTPNGLVGPVGPAGVCGPPHPYSNSSLQGQQYMATQGQWSGVGVSNNTVSNNTQPLGGSMGGGIMQQTMPMPEVYEVVTMATPEWNLLLALVQDLKGAMAGCRKTDACVNKDAGAPLCEGCPRSKFPALSRAILEETVSTLVGGE